MTELSSFVNFLFGHNRRLNHIIRFSTRLRNYDENVASHSFYVCLYSLILGDICNKLGYKVNIEMLMKKALLHDLEESASGDVITIFKKMMKKAYTKLTEISILKVFEHLPPTLRNKYSQIWRTHSSGKEGWIVKLADDLEGLIYCQEQIDMGNEYFTDIRNDYITRIKKAVENTVLSLLPNLLASITNHSLQTKKTIKLHYD